jgi:hypothetical protein
MSSTLRFWLISPFPSIPVIAISIPAMERVRPLMKSAANAGLLKTHEKRLLARAAQKCVHGFASIYTARTAGERLSIEFFSNLPGCYA